MQVSPLTDLPEYEFWTSQRHSPLARDVSLAPSSPRKMSRKLPPVLTESLENLSSSGSISGASLESPTHRPTHLLSVDAPNEIVDPYFQARTRKVSTTSDRSVQSTDSTHSPSAQQSSAQHYTLNKHLTSVTSSALMRSAVTQPSVASGSRPSISSIPPSLTCSNGSTCGTWSVLDEIEMAERAAGKKKLSKEDKKLEKARRKLEDASFDANTTPSVRQLFEASLLEVVGEHGERVRFGDLVRQRKTVVIFIRHWFCPLCAQYMDSIMAEITPEALELAEVDLVIIGNGSDKMLSAYRNKAFKCPFKMYTDPTLRLYRALGLTRQTYDAGDDAEKGDYIVLSNMQTTKRVVKRAVQMMPIRNPGHFSQLGGEFVFDGALNVLYTHRMTTTRSHAPIRQVVAEAGVDLTYYECGPSPPPIHRSSYDFGDGQRDWRDDREDELSRIRELKMMRRGFAGMDLAEHEEGYEMDVRHAGQTLLVEADEDRDAYAQGLVGVAQ